MAQIVTCIYCKEKFDKLKKAYIQIPVGKTTRHAHADCYLRQKIDTPNLEEYEIIDPNDLIKCVYCKREFNKKKEDWVQVSNCKFAHAACAEKEQNREKTDAEKLDLYIMNLYGLEYVPPNTKKQISQFIKDYNYSYSGILKSLQYYYEIKGHTVDTAYNYSIGIVPYIYQQAYQYFYNLWLAQSRNETKNITEYVPKTIIIHAAEPQVKLRRRRRFGFLDQEEDI